MMKSIVLATVMLGCLASQAVGQTICDQRGAFLKELGDEAPVALGLASNGTVIEVLASAKGNWTIILTTPEGLSCVVAYGEAWEQKPGAIAPEPEA